MDDKVLKAALAGLLHDVGKFAQRANVKPQNEDFNESDYGKHGYHALLSSDFIKDYMPAHLQKGLSGVLYHHRADLDEPSIHRLQLADHFAAGERRTGSEEQADPKDARLIPVLSNVELLQPSPMGRKHRLEALDVQTAQSTYPTDSQEGDYAGLWKQMTGELMQWKQEMGQEWEMQSGEDYFTTLLAVFQKYLWCIPSATPWQEKEIDKPYRAWPDVSLYDHNRLTSAIAACLAYDETLPEEKSDQTVALLARGDVSGIQGFIYRLSRPEAETEHIAKRLRGRSFYLQLLTEVAVDWILREIGLPPSCAIFVGGGRFDLLLPLKASEKLQELNESLTAWLFKEFQGEIGLLIAAREAKPDDFTDTREISMKLDEQLEISKRRKWMNNLNEETFFNPIGDQWHVCSVCRLTTMPDPGICPLCVQHENIGKHLPHARYLAFCYDTTPALDGEQIIRFEDAPFGAQVAILRNDQDLQKLRTVRGRMTVYSVNQTDKFIIPGMVSSFRFLANAAPKAKGTFQVSGEPTVEDGDVLHFEAIAELSKGARRIGVLKADVDRLGLVMSEGLSDEDDKKATEQVSRPTLSRVAALSRMLDLFFAGHLNRICDEVFLAWEKNSQHERVGETDGLFYVMYSGGDDLFIVGPWDQVLVLALKLRNEFYAFTGQNPNLTLSAGYVQVKPRYPTQKFAELVDEAEKQAKSDGRNRLSAFGETMLWTDDDLSEGQKEASFKWLQKEAERWVVAIDAKPQELPGGLIYDLGGLFRQHRQKDGKLRPMWTPRLYYTLARRLKPEVRKKFEEGIFKAITSRKTLVPVSIASLSIRERSK